MIKKFSLPSLKGWTRKSSSTWMRSKSRHWTTQYTSQGRTTWHAATPSGTLPSRNQCTSFAPKANQRPWNWAESEENPTALSPDRRGVRAPAQDLLSVLEAPVALTAADTPLTLAEASTHYAPADLGDILTDRAPHCACIIWKRPWKHRLQWTRQQQ